VAAVLESPRRQQARWRWWIALVLQWGTLQSPRDFGFYRSRWTCGTMVALLAENYGVRAPAGRRSGGGCTRKTWSGADPGPCWAPGTPMPFTGKVVKVTDGDTIHVLLDSETH
jgi:hypothetical protein